MQMNNPAVNTNAVKVLMFRRPDPAPVILEDTRCYHGDDESVKCSSRSLKPASGGFTEKYKTHVHDHI
uniref:Uncharacterized protein n=1 Tax=Nothobranchius kadleci TaxID=1051664 RepID=A0A1A8BUI1_NOTKA